MTTTTPTIVQRTIIPVDDTPTPSSEGPSAPARFWLSTSLPMSWAVEYATRRLIARQRWENVDASDGIACFRRVLKDRRKDVISDIMSKITCVMASAQHGEASLTINDL